MGAIFATAALLATIVVINPPTVSAERVECPSGEMTFTDIPETSFARTHIICVRELEIAFGLTDTTFGPNDRVTREQMASFIARTYRVINGSPAPVVPTTFTDIDGSFAKDDIARIFGLGITAGTNADNTLYSPGDFVTREQMAAFLARLRRTLEGFCATPATPFTDVPDTSFAKADIACIFGLEVTAGRTATEYVPGGFVTRAEMATFLSRLYQIGRRDAQFTPDPTPGNGDGGTGGDDGLCSLRTEYVGVNEVVRSEHAAVWWGPTGGDLNAVADLVLEDVKNGYEKATNSLSITPPSGVPAFCLNMYVIDTGAETDGLTRGFGLDVNGIPFVNLPLDIAQDFLINPPGPNTESAYVTHELMHLLQVGAPFPQDGDSDWYWEATAEWFVDQVYPNDSEGKDTIGQYLINPQLPLWASRVNQGVDQADLSNSRRFHHFGAQAFLTWLSDDVPGAAQLIGRAWDDVPADGLPQQWLSEQLGGTVMEDEFVEFASRAATVDFPRHAAAIEQHRITAINSGFNTGDVNHITATVPDAGITWTRPPANLRPGGFAYNTITSDITTAGNVTVEFAADPTGSAGTTSDMRGIAVRVRAGVRQYTTLVGGSASVSVQPGDELWLVVVSVPDLFGTQETFDYQYRFVR